MTRMELDFKRRLFFLTVMGAIFTLFLGFRASSVGTDTPHYQNYYAAVAQQFFDTQYKLEWLFHELAVIGTFIGLSCKQFFATIALINFLCIIWLTALLAKGQALAEVSEQCPRDSAKRQLFSKAFYESFLLLMTAFMLSPFFFSAMTNVIRQGTATLILMGVSLRWIFAPVSFHQFLTLILMILISLGFHRSSILLIALIPLMSIHMCLLHGIVFLLFIGYVTGISLHGLSFFGGLVGFDVYTSIVNAYPTDHYHAGIRYDFAFFTVFMGIFFHRMGSQFLNNYPDKVRFENLLKPYWVFSLPFFIIGFGAYSDRLLLGSWVYLSVLAAGFFSQLLPQYGVSKRWYEGAFFMAACFFFIKLKPCLGWLGA